MDLFVFDNFLFFLKNCFTYSAVIIFLGSFRSDSFRKFESVILILIFCVSFFALIVTNFKTLFVFSFIGIILYIGLSKVKLKLDLIKKSELIVAFVFFLLFYLIFFAFQGFVLSYPNEDYLIYERIAHYNYKYGVENTRTFYNVIPNSQPDIELYHFFELWAVTMLTKLNGLRFLDNYILVFSPVLVWISWLGIRELVNSDNYKVSFVLILLIVLFINPFDFLINFLGLSIPVSGLGGIIIGLKYLLILPILIYALIQISKENKTNYYLLSLFSFLYLLVFPILLLASIIFDFLFRKLNLKEFIISMVFGLGFLLISYLTKSEGVSIVVELSYLLDFKLLIKVFVFGIFLPSLLLYLVKENKKINNDFFSFFLITSIIGSILWVLFNDNIDANQLHRSVISPFFPLLLILFVSPLIKINVFGFLLFLSYSIFIFIILPNYFQNVKLNDDEMKFLDVVKGESRVLYVPNQDFVQSIYHYNERFYFKYLKIFYYHPELDVVNYSCFLPITQRANTKTSKFMINNYRNISPVFNNCASSYDLDNCLKNFALRIGAGIIVNENKDFVY